MQNIVVYFLKFLVIFVKKIFVWKLFCERCTWKMMIP